MSTSRYRLMEQLADFFIHTVNGQRAISSLHVARHFNIDHAVVLKIIREYLFFGERRTFAAQVAKPVEYKNEKNQKRRAYYLTAGACFLLIVHFDDARTLAGRGDTNIKTFSAMAEATGFDKCKHFKEIFPPDLFNKNATGIVTYDIIPGGCHHVQ